MTAELAYFLLTALGHATLLVVLYFKVDFSEMREVGAYNLLGSMQL